jgi:hypothetical protein
MTIQYSYFKRYSMFSSGGVIKPIEKRTAKSLITRFKGELLNERFRLIGETRSITLSNRNIIYISLS